MIGGSFAGLSAAMYVARGRRRVFIPDAESPRNRFAANSRGFFAQDGRGYMSMAISHATFRARCCLTSDSNPTAYQ